MSKAEHKEHREIRNQGQIGLLKIRLPRTFGKMNYVPNTTFCNCRTAVPSPPPKKKGAVACDLGILMPYRGWQTAVF